jgi:hypothetical protein
MGELLSARRAAQRGAIGSAPLEGPSAGQQQQHEEQPE